MRVLVVLSCFVLASCVDRAQTIIDSAALSVGNPQTVFVATSREKEPDGTYGFKRSAELSFLEVTVSIPPDHTTGDLSYSYGNPDPKDEFVIADVSSIASAADMGQRLTHHTKKNNWADKEVTIFVHGYNTTQTEVVMRGAQLAYDTELPGSMLTYSWPSRGAPLGYAYDLDSMLFARDGLEETVRMVKAAGAKRVILLAHSMGTALTMEMLRQADIRNPGWAARTLDGVVLMSPDIDIDLFESQVTDMSKVPEPFMVMVSEKDRLLNISGRLRGTNHGERLGNVRSAKTLSHLPIEIIDLTAFSDDASSGHFIAATSPSLLALIQSSRRLGQTLHPQHTNLLENILPSVPLTKEPDGKYLISPRPGEER